MSDDVNLYDLSVEELELRIKLAQHIIRWLNSDDPMLSDPEYLPLVNPARDRHGKELRQLIVVCRDKKVQRLQAEADFVEHIQVGLRPGKLDAKGLR